MAIKPTPRKERFWRFVRVTDGCWEWTGHIKSTGYGQFTWSNHVPVSAHRAAYRMFIGPVPDGMFVCHHCDNRRCVRFDHLFLGTPRDNTQDMVAKGRTRSSRWYFESRTHCRNGHPYPDNQVRCRGQKRCEVCREIQARRDVVRRTERRRAARMAVTV